MATLRGTNGRDTLQGGSEDDRIFGLAGADVLFGGGGDDQIRGSGGRDQVVGGAGNDRLLGGGGGDQISGGADNDRLEGGGGADVLSGGAGADRFVYRSAGEGRDRITDFDPDEGDALRLNGALIGAAVRTVDDGTDTTVQVRTAAADDFTNLAVLENFRQPIDVWYGDQQQFGDPGEAQRWVNVLGTVSTQGLTSLAYALNGGPEQALTTGADGARLDRPGDFNIEIDYDQLDPSAADDLVTIEATFGNGQVFTRDVTIDYEGGQVWPTSYAIDWAGVSDLQEVVQVVDGRWAFDDGGVRPAERGYDRVLAIGDAAWDSYRLELEVTPHDLQTNGGNFFIGMQWSGHTDDPSVPGLGGPPHEGWIPSAAFLFTGSRVRLHPTEWFADRDGDGEIDLNPIVVRDLALDEGQTYNILIENQRVAADIDPSDGIDRTFRLRVWEAGDPEPTDWLIEHTMVDQAPRGSLYLNAHHHDVTFGDLEVTPLPAGDVVASRDDLDALLAAGAEPAAEVAEPRSAGQASASIAPAASGPNLADLVVSGDEAAAAV